MELSRLMEEHDPLALHLALLRFGYSTPPVLAPARRHRANETLQRWRYTVADWTEMRPAFKLLHRVEVDLNLPSGSKFATFTHLDQALGYLTGTVHR